MVAFFMWGVRQKFAYIIETFLFQSLVCMEIYELYKDIGDIFINFEHALCAFVISESSKQRLENTLP